MKKALYLIIFLFCATASFAQTPGTFNYQAVLRDASGGILSNTQMLVTIEILQESADGILIYSEEWDIETNSLGLINLEIGSVDPDNFELINWRNGPFFMAVHVNDELLGTSQLLSVPFAMQAQTVVNEKQNIFLDGNQLSITNGSTVTLPNGGSDQTLTIIGHELSISDGNTITLPDRYIDADSNPFNEIELPEQESADANKGLVADGAGGVSWQPTTIDTKLSESEVDDFVQNNGYQLRTDDGDTDNTNELNSVFEINVSSAGIKTYTTPFVIRNTALVYVNGKVISNTQWAGAGTSTITLNIHPLIYDNITILN